MKKLLSFIIILALLITSIPIVFAATGYTKNNIDSYVGKKIIDLNYYHSSKGYYPYKKRLDSDGNLQCVGYAYARLEEKLGLSPDFSSGNGAKDIPNNAPNNATRTAEDGTVYTIKVYKNDGGSNIVANSWVSFGPGNSIYGHVIFVEEVIGDTIYYSESGTSMWKNGTSGTLKKKSKTDFINNCSSGGTYVGTVVFVGGNGNVSGVHTCSSYETYKNGGTKVLGACKVCHKKFDYSKIHTGDVAGLWIAKKNQNINLYSEPYEDATYTSVKSGELEVRGYVNNAYGNKWYVINGDKNKTYYVYENTFKNLYTQDSHYYESNNHRYESGAVIEAPNTNNNGGNNAGLGNSIVGIVDIPSSWDNLSIRTGPSTNYQIIGSMNDGVRCNVYPAKTQNGWYYVEYNGIYGYASGKQINTNNSSTTTTPSTSSAPADLALSASTVNLHYPNSSSQTVTVSGIGDLPSKYQFDIEIASDVFFSWGTPSNNSVTLTLSVNQYSSSTTATIYLKDSNGNYLSSKKLNINVTQAPVEKNTVNLIFDYNGANENNYTMTGERNSIITIPKYTPERNGYAFLGWNTNANSTTALYSNGEGVRMGNTDLVLYAIWEKADTYWSSWNLNISKDELYFDTNDYEKTVLIRVDKQDAREFYFTLEFDARFDAELGDEWYDENGYFCTEVIVSAPEQQIENNKITIRMRDENHNIVDSTGFYVYLEEETNLFSDRNQAGISVYLNGKKLTFDVQPQIINSRTMVPMRKIFEELGTVVGWNNNTQRAISVKKGDIVSVSIGGQYLTVNGEQKLLDSPPIIISGRTLVPVRAIAESFNCDVDWYDFGASQVVDINMQDTINNMENKGGLLIGYSEFPPFSFYDDNGNLIGFDTELAKYVCDFWGWDCSFIEIPFDMKFNAINSGRIDCYWNGITKTEEREELCTFTNDYVEYTYQTEEDGEWQTWHDVYSVPFRKDDYDTVQLVNIALEEAEKDGTIAYLKYKYGIE